MPPHGPGGMMRGDATFGRLHGGHLILAALALACAILAWRAVGIALAPLPSAPPFAPPALADRALLARFDPFFPAQAAGGESLPVTALPFSLHGVRADSATGRGSAIIAAADGMQKVYAVGDMVADGVSLAAIAADHVVLDRGGTREALWLDSAGAAAAATPADPMAAALGAPSSAAPASPSSPDAAPADPAPPSVLPDDEPQAPPSRQTPPAPDEDQQP